jgi:DNA-binding CsgD family transcriptional regulator
VLYEGSNPELNTSIEKIGITAYMVMDALTHMVFFILALLPIHLHIFSDHKGKWKRIFSGLVLFGMASRTILILIRDLLYIHTLLYMLIFFAGIFIPVLYLRWVSNQVGFEGCSETGDQDALERFYSRHNITKREVDVVTQICLGKSNQEIADALFISLQTVKDHTHRIYQKTGVNTRMQLANMINMNTAGPSKN